MLKFGLGLYIYCISSDFKRGIVTNFSDSQRILNQTSFLQVQDISLYSDKSFICDKK